jgi:biphenyl-2,3-diol 1,2-dioxygenase
MAISALGYICVRARDLPAWERFATGVLGLQAQRDADGALLLRADSRSWRFRIEQGDEDDVTTVGWECTSEADYLATLAKLGDRATINPALAASRGVRALAQFTDPAGMACELHWGPTDAPHVPFASPLGVSGFVTAEQGLGHVVIVAADPAGYEAFYKDLGFSVSDYIDMPFGPDLVLPVTFMHCNPRHHTLAFAPAPAVFTKKCIHLMLQTQVLDDVGLAIDRAEKLGTPIAMTLGRHSNDQMLSVYFETPSGIEFEYGWGARVIEPGWQVVRRDAISIWGHKMIGGPAVHG